MESFHHFIDRGDAAARDVSDAPSTAGGGAMTFTPTVLRVHAPQELRWRGRLLLPRIFDGEHMFELEPREGATRFVQREEFRGALVTPLLAWVGGSTQAGTSRS